MMCVWHV